MPDLSSERVLAFLTLLERECGCSPQTCNQRLHAIRSFARFIGSRSPEHLEWCGQVRAIALKKTPPPPVTYLEKPEIDALLAVPDRDTAQGLREPLARLAPVRLETATEPEAAALWNQWVERYHPRGYRQPIGAHLRYWVRDGICL